MKVLAYRSNLTNLWALGGFLAFVTLFCWTEYSNWRTQVTRVETSLEQTAKAITLHADDVIEMARLPLASLVSEIGDGGKDADLPARIRALIAGQMKASPTLDTLSYINADGDMVATSSAEPPTGINYSDRVYFSFHKTRPLKLPIVGAPIESRLSRLWVIPITQKVILADGSFGGVVVSTIRVNHFINFFRNFDVGSDGAFLLVRGDGIVLARGPARANAPGLNLSAMELFTQHLKRQTVGAYHYTSPIDDTDRAGGFFQSERTGIVALASSAERDILLTWMMAAKARWIYAAILLAVTLLAAVHWRRQTMLRRQSEALVAAREAEFRLLAESSSDVISRFDENGMREYVSPSSTEILGIEPSRLIGRSVFAGMAEDTTAMVRQAADRLKTGSTQEKFTTRHVKPGGEIVWLETALSKLPATPDQPATRVVAITRDVSRHKKMQDELDTLAHTDELTRLSNRRFFNMRFEEMMQRALRTATPLTLLMIDADQFKLYNDTYGHAAGDECLRQIGMVIRDCVSRPGDVAARYGGEEFSVLLADTNDAQAAVVAEELRARVEALSLTHIHNTPLGIATISIGMASHDPSSPSPVKAQALFAQADDALYSAKSAGRNRVVSTPKRSRSDAKSN
jgi:diguanylate cyclase (GGDEF)-like protein/PAS domain S-box-containing protein